MDKKGDGGNKFVLGDEDEGSPPTLRPSKSHPLFSELATLVQEESGELQWKQRARWVKYEESVEQGGNRWSKPHVATVSLHSVLELRNYLNSNLVLLDVPAQSMEEVADVLLDNLEENGILEPEKRMEVKGALLRKHTHLYNQQHLEPNSSVSRLPVIRSLAEIGRSMSSKSTGAISTGNGESMSRSKTQESAMEEDSNHLSPNPKGNKQFMRKIPKGSEASNILVGELHTLRRPIAAFIRLAEAVKLGDVTEVPLPTRFIFILLGPKGRMEKYNEVGRAMATLFSDDIFHEVAYKARSRKHLLEGVDDFLEHTTVLPPGTWDPSIRIEPPTQLPPKKGGDPDGGDGGGPEELDSEAEEEEETRLREENGLTRTGRLFGGLCNDIKRKVPWYWSDFKDAFSSQCVASWLFLYFACLTPIITFGGLLGKATNNNMAAIESLVSGFICGIGYGFLSGQPLTILGSTGPVLVFESILVQFCESYELNYLEFRLWVGIWVAIILFILVALDASAYVCFITRFTEENFATLIALIFMVEAVKNVGEIGQKFPVNKFADHSMGYSCECLPNNSLEFEQDNITWEYVKFHECESAPFYGHLVGGGCDYIPDVFLMSVCLFIGTFLISLYLKNFKMSSFFPTSVRQVVSDFAVIIAIVSMTLFDMYMKLRTPKLQVPERFEPTLPTRGWVINPFGGNPLWTIFAAPAPALLATILIFMDQQITAVIMNRKEHLLKKGCGYHLDLMILSGLILGCSFIGIPWFVAATVLSMNHVNSLKMESESAAPGEKPKFLGIREQRVTHILIFLTIGLSVFMTPLLKNIPMPVLYGVFLYMGFSSLNGMQLFDRILIMFMPTKHQPDHMFLRKVPLGRVHLYTIIQLACLICLWVVKSVKKISILFPMMLVIMILVRKLLDFVFTKRELKILDDILPKSTRPASKTPHDNGGKGAEKSKDLENNSNFNNNFQITLNGAPLDRKVSVNVTEEINKTGIWSNLNVGNGGLIDRSRNSAKDAINEEEKQRLT
ncbi:Sodium-driven chloride bicarbonate exchanger [Orchesella cincta]|uniref:Anion exchange protein n=1 Tax=Orchesella cincta TaxID=48709 RepID=A0A1D2M8P9_ORCCI|nr:Sodium-driven chloride bicarbonate exchanger [Orchesella cincta]